MKKIILSYILCTLCSFSDYKPTLCDYKISILSYNNTKDTIDLRSYRRPIFSTENGISRLYIPSLNEDITIAANIIDFKVLSIDNCK